MPTEAELILAGREGAQRRLDAARREESSTRHMPPSDRRREEAVEELRDAETVAREWCIAL
jgi:hypothetical protein